jgi:uncharacterized protein YcfJ
LVACLSLVLSGCSTQSQRIGADDGSDVCHQQRVALDSTGDFFTEDIVKGAAVGAIGGALIGGLIGGNARGAAFGALAGGMAGAASGYWTARQKQATDQASLYQTVYGDIERDNISIGRTQVAFDQLVDCRRAEAARVRMGLRTGRLTPDQAQIAMAAVRERSDRDLRIAQSISTNIQSRSSDFAFANEQMNPGAAASASSAPVRGAPARVAQPGTPAGQVQTATLTNLSKRDQFSQSIARVQADRSAFELS